MSEIRVGRWLFSGEGLIPGYLRIVDGTVAEVCPEPPPADSTRSVVLPAFVNAHTHIGDAFAFPAPPGTVEETVGPGGYKHRVLGSASGAEKAAGMRSSIDLMLRTGTTSFVDYREEGIDGARALRETVSETPVRGVVLGRPARVESFAEEIDALLEVCDGLAFSAISDLPKEVLIEASARCRRDGKLFSIHASEVRREPIDEILELKPDFVVHMTAATDEDLAECAEAEVPIVICPRSNAFFGIRPDIPRLLRLGTTVALGTDNAMICPPDMLSEMRAAFELSRRFGGVSSAEAIYLATLSGRKVLNAKGKITTEMIASDDLIAIEVEGEDPLLELVSSAETASVSAVTHQGKVWRPSVWTT
ncbi:MAG: amidohydrolase family protein [Thermoplasmata archaeon]|nr:amidohydrolase family protein [Thermoplasmata archaeon]